MCLKHDTQPTVTRALRVQDGLCSRGRNTLTLSAGAGHRQHLQISHIPWGRVGMRCPASLETRSEIFQRRFKIDPLRMKDRKTREVCWVQNQVCLSLIFVCFLKYFHHEGSVSYSSSTFHLKSLEQDNTDSSPWNAYSIPDTILNALYAPSYQASQLPWTTGTIIICSAEEETETQSSKLTCPGLLRIRGQTPNHHTITAGYCASPRKL